MRRRVSINLKLSNYLEAYANNDVASNLKINFSIDEINIQYLLE